jgi:hypothetical protein
MIDTAFPRTLWIHVGLGFPRNISCARDAIAYLDEVPRLMRDDAYAVTRQACREALAGMLSPDEAYDMMCAYARRRGVLLDDAVMELGLVVDTVEQLRQVA